MASKLSLTLRLSIYFSRDHSTLPAEIRTHSEVPGPCSLQVHKDLFAIKRQTPLIALFPDAFQLDYGAYLTRAQIQLLEIYWMVFRCFEKFARVKPCNVQLGAQANRTVFFGGLQARVVHSSRILLAHALEKPAADNGLHRPLIHLLQ